MAKLTMILDGEENYIGLYVDGNLEANADDFYYTFTWVDLIEKFKTFEVEKKQTLLEDITKRNLPQTLSDFPEGSLIEYVETEDEEEDLETEEEQD